jgi:hypothetical protein
MKSVQVVSRSAEYTQGVGVRGVNLNAKHCMHVWKQHNETPLYN